MMDGPLRGALEGRPIPETGAGLVNPLSGVWERW